MAETKKGKPAGKKPAKKSASKPTKKSAPKKATTIKQKFPIVGLGASAGGLEALEAFFSNLPPTSNIAYVIIQHLSPKHKSIMSSLLAKSTEMEVTEIENEMEIQPNHVYLNPPDRNVVIQNGRLQLAMPIRTDRPNLPIDCFFKSMALDLGEKAICIILSGTATDGTLGLKAIKGSGGIAMVQDPNTAKYDGMPRSAIATGTVDFILPVEKLPAQLIKYVMIALTAFAMKGDQEKFLNEGFDEYVSKPLNLELLTKKIEGLLN
ncbi:MAG: hypothetical protein HQ517_07740 [SAR324 cluster bacterium]|nr:hypothetical protein [SAR324 cluster bacterium]